jgi:two-component system, sensor histidine kinase
VKKFFWFSKLDLASNIGPRGYSAEVTIETVTRMLRLTHGITLFMPLLAVPSAWVFWDVVPRPWIMFLLAAGIVIPVAQFMMARQFLAYPSDLRRAVFFGRLTTITAIASGFGWGLAGLALPYTQTPGQQLIILGLVIGIPAGSIFGSAHWPATQYANSGLAVGMTAIGLLFHGSPGSIGMAVALMVYLPIVWVQTELGHRSAIDSIHLRFENLDLVRRLETEKNLAEQANAAKSKFLAAASHDLRQPLHSLGLFVTTLNQRLKRSDLQPLLGNIDSSVVALHGLLNALLDISRLDAGAVEPDIRDVNLTAMLVRLSDEYGPEARNKGLNWRWNCPELAVRSDPPLLETILRNLISNALRYTEHGEVSVECIGSANVVSIAIRDSGMGIDLQHQKEIFREFFQLHNPERDRAKGLGLGLAIVDRLVKLLGHQLELRSRPSEGTTFKLILLAGDRDGIAPDPTPSEDTGESALRVLVIDDEASVRDAMGVLLGDWGHEVIEAGSLEEAQHALERAPDVIVTDYRLRDEQTGVAAIQAIEARFGVRIPALIVTGDTHPDRIAQARSSGYALLHKPVAPAKLRAFIRSARSR